MSDANPKLIIGDDWKRREPEAPKPAPAPAPPSEGQGGLVVDSDWKSQAQAEKERLAAAEKEKEAKGGSAAAGRGRGLPPADFNSLVGTLVTQAFMYLGGFPDPETGKAIVSLEHARFHIDLLTVLQKKTAGNLTPEEAEDVSRALHELQLRYVEIGQAVAEMAKQQRSGGPRMGGPGGPSGMMGGPGGAGLTFS
ncbi:MAG: DUF1844 domain-containing protein [Polaromonas sp.]